MPSIPEDKMMTGVTNDGKEILRVSSDKETYSSLVFTVDNDPFIDTLTFARVYSKVLETGTPWFG